VADARKRTGGRKSGISRKPPEEAPTASEGTEGGKAAAGGRNRPKATLAKGDRLKRRYTPDPARRRLKLSEMIAAQILDEITSKDLVEGDPLTSEAAMLQVYEGGRASLREALRILETNGLITIKAGPNGGAVVGAVDPVQFGRMSSRYFQMSGATIRDLIDARLILEPAATALAAERRDPRGVETLQRWLDREERVKVSDDSVYMSDAHDFHSILLSMSGNVILDLIALSIKDVFNSRVRSAIYPVSARKHVQEVHKEIAALVLAGQGEAAGKMMREHLEEFAVFAARRLPGLLDDLVSWQ
jgi:GntR family transcriptional repressor for pyruvate dehydrogenase complex